MNDIMTLNSPEDWKLHRLGQLFRERKEKGSDKDFAPLSVTMRGIVPQLATAAKSDDGDNRKVVRVGDYAINSRSDRKGSGGISDHEGSVSLISIVLEPRDIDRGFSHHLLRSPAFQEEFYRWGHGIVADLWTTRYSDMKNIRLRVPDLPTQRAIADFLDRETARIDSLIEKKQRLIELLGERLTLSIRNLVTRGTYENTNNAPSGLYWCPFLPQNWQVRKGFHIGTLIGSIGGEETDDTEETLPYIKVSDLNACDGGRLITTKSMFRPQSRPVSQFRDFLVFPKRGAAIFTNKVAIAPKRSAIDPNVMGWAIFKHHEPEYFLWVLKIRTLDNLADISTVPQINNKHIYPERFPVPPRDEQIKIVREIKRVLSRADKTSDLTQTSIDRLKEYRSALITSAVTGQIDVSTYARSETTDRQLDSIQSEMQA